MAAAAPSGEATAMELLGVIMGALGTAPGMAGQQALISNAMRILGGDWSPVDTARPALKDFLNKHLGGNAGPAALMGLGEHMAANARDAMGAEGPMNVIVASYFKDDADPFGAIYEGLKSHLPRVLSLTLSHNDASGLYSTALKSLCVVMVGETLERLATQMTQGAAGLQSLFQEIRRQYEPIFNQRYPQHMQAVMFGFPMAMNMLVQLHGQWKAGR
jgi:hypothetical protein